jgi:HAD superfamily hydrolase (TIGR01509 family)
MIRAVIFDFDGLILETETPEYQSWQEVYQQYGCELSIEWWLSGLGLGWGSSDPYQALEVLVGHPLDRDAIRQTRRARHQALLLECPIQPGVVAYLQAAAQMGLQVGIASSSPRAWIVPHLQRLGLAESFPRISCADDVQCTKPAPEVYQASLVLLGIPPEEAIALEDSPNGVAAATAAGIFCVAVPNPLTRHLPFAEANLRLASLADLPLADVMRLAEEHYLKYGRLANADNHTPRRGT